MSILSGVFKKFKDYILIDGKYVLSSRWTKSDAVIMGDGSDDSNTLEKNLGSINGITDSLTATNSKVALSSVAGKNLQDQITLVNNNLPPYYKLFRNFDGAEDTLRWSIQTGQPVMGLAVDMGCFGFRKNCPIDGQLSLVIDGRVYQNEGQFMCLDTQNYSDYAAPKNHKQAYAASELDTYTSDVDTMGVTPAGVRKAINGRFSLSGTTLYINTL